MLKLSKLTHAVVVCPSNDLWIIFHSNGAIVFAEHYDKKLLLHGAGGFTTFWKKHFTRVIATLGITDCAVVTVL